MTQQSIRSFLIGLGNIGMRYDLENTESLGRTHARAIQKHPNFVCVGAFDISKAARREFEKHYETNTYNSLEKGLSETQPDFVIISTPTKQHLEDLRVVLSHCVPRVILCEKPLANSASYAREVVAKVKENNIGLFVNYFRCSNPTSKVIRENIQSGNFKSPFVGTGRYNKGSLHTASHFLNLLIYWFGEPVKVENLGSEINKFDDSDPNSYIILTFRSGRIELVPDSVSTELVFELEVKFSNGRLEYLNEGNLIDWHEDSHAKTRRFNSNFEKSQLDVLQNVYNFLNGSKYSLCNGESAIEYISILKSKEKES